MSKIAFAGDSILALGWASGSVQSNIGVAPMIAALGGHLFDEAVSVAVGGTTTANLNAVVGENAAQIPQVISAAPDWCYINAGSNDAWDLRSVSAVMNDLLDACTTLKNAGIKVAMTTPLMRSDVGVTSAMQTRIREIAAAIGEVPTGSYWDVLIDQTHAFPEWTVLGNPELVDSALSNGGSGDAGVHPNVLGSKIIADRAITRLAPLISPPGQSSIYENYPAQLGNDGMMDGNMTGELATGWVAVGAGLGGVSGVLAKEAVDGAERQTLTLSGTATTDNLAYIYGPAIAATSGQKVRARATLRFDDDVTGLCGCSVGLANDSLTVRAQAFRYGNNAADNGLIPAGTEFTIWSQVYTPSGAENLLSWCELVFRNGAACAGKITFVNPDIVLVA